MDKTKREGSELWEDEENDVLEARGESGQESKPNQTGSPAPHGTLWVLEMVCGSQRHAMWPLISAKLLVSIL